MPDLQRGMFVPASCNAFSLLSGNPERNYLCACLLDGTGRTGRRQGTAGQSDQPLLLQGVIQQGFQYGYLYGVLLRKD
jgi:hypothetical protein